MKFIKRWFSKAVHNALEYNQCKVEATIGRDLSSSNFRDTSSLNIEVRSAIGGKIVSFNSYDRIRDRHELRNYLIHDEADFERELGKIITIESMRQS